MTDQTDFVEKMASNVRDEKWTDAAVLFLEEASRSAPEKLTETMAALKARFKQDGLPELQIETENSGSLKKVSLNNGWFFDTPLYEKLERRGNPLPNESLERLANHFEGLKNFENNYGGKYGVLFSVEHIKAGGDFLLRETAKLSKEDRIAVLKRSSELSYKQPPVVQAASHTLNVLFADLDGDGKAEELSDFALTYDRLGRHSQRIDLYDPPSRPEKK